MDVVWTLTTVTLRDDCASLSGVDLQRTADQMNVPFVSVVVNFCKERKKFICAKRF